MYVYILTYIHAYHRPSSKQRGPIAAFPEPPTLADPISLRPRRLVSEWARVSPS